MHTCAHNIFANLTIIYTKKIRSISAGYPGTLVTSVPRSTIFGLTVVHSPQSFIYNAEKCGGNCKWDADSERKIFCHCTINEFFKSENFKFFNVLRILWRKFLLKINVECQTLTHIDDITLDYCAILESYWAVDWWMT